MDFVTRSSYASSELLYTHRIHHNLTHPSTVTESHNVYEVLYVKKGDITYVAEDKVYYVKDNDIIITPPGKIHTLFFNDLAEYERYDVFFEKSIVYPSVYEKLREIADVINTDSNPHIGDMFTKLDLYYDKFKEDEFGNILKNITEEILYNIILLSKSHTGAYSSNTYMTKAIRYIEQNITTNFSLDDMCNELYFTKSTLHRLFKRHLQVTPKQYITLKRLEKAQQMLKKGMKPTDVYIQCGFIEYSTFWRDYKNYYGCSPSDGPTHTPTIKTLI